MSGRFHERFPDYDVLDKWDSPSWNDQTRAVVNRRLHQVPGRRFLSEAEWEMLEGVCDRLIPQPDRREAPVPIVPFIDEKLFKNQGDGYRFEGMPPMREAWRRGIAAVDDEARTRWGAGFRELPVN
ncbi:MAG: gluconate 2-dehydrogenase subunit 3 family protein, partial [Alphaproteobacteria bacterium]|nr:gluconate 2-dehydrogenase subunit 3 family protein [Alphaproteobacteria bacterium]